MIWPNWLRNLFNQSRGEAMAAYRVIDGLKRENAALQAERDRLAGLVPPAAPALTLTRVTQAFVQSALSEAGLVPPGIPFGMGPGVSWHSLDTEYWLCDLQTFDEVLSWDWTEKRAWVENTFDCDKHALRFQANCVDAGLTGVGVVIDYAAGHAYNLVVFSDGSVRLYEPQFGGYVEARREPGSLYRIGEANTWLVL